MKISKVVMLFVICLSVTSLMFGGMSVDNYFNQPEGSSSSDNILTINGTQNVASGGDLNVELGGTLDTAVGSTMTVSGLQNVASGGELAVQSGGTLTIDSGSTVTIGVSPTFSAGINVDEDVDIDFDARDEEFNITTSSQGLIVATIYNSSADLVDDTALLSLDLKDNGDAEGRYIQCRDETFTKTVFNVGADGVVTIDASGGGSGLIIAEALITPSDEELRLDSETQDVTVGDGTNDTVFADDGCITQTGDATQTWQDGSDMIVTANANASPFVAASGDDTMLGALTMGSAEADGGVFSIIKGATGSDPTFSITQGATDVTLDETVGDLNLTSADDMTITATGDNISLVSASVDVSGTLDVSGAAGTINIDVSGSGSGLIITESLLTPSDEEFRLDSVTQDITIGDGTNDTVFSDAGAISQTGTATLTIQDGSDLICTANADLSPFLSAGSADEATGLITATGGITIPSGATFTIDAGATVVSTAAAFMNITGASGLTVTYGVDAASFTSTAEATVGTTLAVGGVATVTGGLVVNEDVDINLDARDEEFNITTSSQGLIAATIYNSSADLTEDTCLLSLDLKDNGDAEGRYLQCRDNTYANTVMEVGSDGAITIDASGGGSGTVLSEATMVVNDAAFDWDSETQDFNIGDGTNDTVFSDDGVITQTGDAQASLLDVTIAGTGLDVDAGDIDVATYVIAGSSNIAVVPISYSLKDTEEVSIATLYAGADANIGWFDLIMGTHTARGSFIADGTITLTADGIGTATTTDNNDTTFNVFDNGTSISFENQCGSTLTLWGTVYWQE